MADLLSTGHTAEVRCLLLSRRSCPLKKPSVSSQSNHSDHCPPPPTLTKGQKYRPRALGQIRTSYSLTLRSWFMSHVSQLPRLSSQDTLSTKQQGQLMCLLSDVKV